MKIPKGFIKDSEGIYRRGNFVFKENKIFRESTIVPKDTVEKLKDNYATKLDCIRAVLAFPAIIGEEPRTTNVYIDKAGKGFKVADKFSKNTVAIVMPDRNVFDIQATDISNSTDFKDLVSKDKPVKPKELKTFGELKESAEGVSEFWDKFDKGEVKIGDKFENGPELLKANKKADYILVFKNDEYVAAWAPELSGGDLVWGQGHYFDTEKDAEEYFSSKLNESAKLNESGILSLDDYHVYKLIDSYDDKVTGIILLDGVHNKEEFQDAVNKSKEAHQDEISKYGDDWSFIEQGLDDFNYQVIDIWDNDAIYY